MTRGSVRAVLFDWDGTLVDSAEATFRCYRQLFATYGIDFDRGRFEETYAPDWRHTYRCVGLPEPLWPEADARWLALYSEIKAPPVPGAADALAHLSAQGLRLGVVTSGERARVEGEIAALGFDRYLPALVCAGEARAPKPAPDPLRLALERLGLSPDAAVFVGDSPEDVEMSRAAGVYAIGVPGGFPNTRGLAAAGPDQLMPSLAEAVRHVLAELPRAGGSRAAL
jgi:HAD superfamily hydrolase (TIGR01509 family)